MKKKLLILLSSLFLSACTTVQYQPLPPIEKVDLKSGYRLSTALYKNKINNNSNDVLMIMSFSGGGTRAAALGYGVLEELSRNKLPHLGKDISMADQVDLVFGVSGGSILAAAFALEGNNIFYSFERQFLKLNLQKQLMKQIFTISNVSRLVSPEFGRGDLLQEQLNLYLFRGATFADLEKNRKGPFAVIGATDMGTGYKFDFTQEKFDIMCLNLSKLPIARATAASSAVPLIFAPITLNNEAGKCNYEVTNIRKKSVNISGTKEQQDTAKRNFLAEIETYNDSQKRPYIHLIDGGLTDNLGIRALLDAMYIFDGRDLLQLYNNGKLPKEIIIVNVNAQTEMGMTIDKSAKIPKTREVIDAIINIPIDVQTQTNLTSLKNIHQEWNLKEEQLAKETGSTPIKMHLISLELKDIQDENLRQYLLQIPTSFYLPSEDIDKLRDAGSALLRQSETFKELQKELDSKIQ